MARHQITHVSARLDAHPQCATAHLRGRCAVVKQLDRRDALRERADLLDIAHGQAPKGTNTKDPSQPVSLRRGDSWPLRAELLAQVFQRLGLTHFLHGQHVGRKRRDRTGQRRELGPVDRIA